MNEKTFAERLGQFAANAKYENIPDEVTESVKGRILDILGICLAAVKLPTSDAAMQWATNHGGTAQATAFGVTHKVPASSAAFVNGVLAHSLDYDDTHLPSILHPSASVIPAALATAEANNMTGRDVLAAVAVGIEVCIRLGMAGFDQKKGNSIFFEHGQHATSITGAMGSAVAVAKLKGFGAQQITHVLGITASMAAGIIEANRTGGTVKRMHCGWAAKVAVTATEFVELGFTGPPTVLEGRFGFYQAWLHGNFDPTPILEELGRSWSVQDVFFKPYPANHFTHAAIDAALALKAEGITPADIVSIEVQTASATLRTIGEPIEVKRNPETGYMAQFSAPYVVAAALTGGSGLGLGLNDFTDEKARAPEIRELMQKISVVASEKCDQIFPYQFPTIITAKTADDRTIVKEILVNRGGNEWPLTYEELAQKFQNNAERVISSEELTTVTEFISTLESQRDVAGIFAINPAH